jgi:putative transposase
VLESVVTKECDKAAALKFIKRAMKRYGSPDNITTDGLRSYRAAMTELGNAGEQHIDCWPTIASTIATCRSENGNRRCRISGE